MVAIGGAMAFARRKPQRRGTGGLKMPKPDDAKKRS